MELNSRRKTSRKSFKDISVQTETMNVHPEIYNERYYRFMYYNVYALKDYC
jgi:hypothetical protein